MHSVRIELAKMILVGTRITYQATVITYQATVDAGWTCDKHKQYGITMYIVYCCSICVVFVYQ